jgi:hypothetical protein
MPSSTVTSKLVTVTPKMAQEWLDTDPENTPDRINRKYRPSWARYLAEQMDLGRWEVLSDGIGFRADGTLINGQHRLQAVIMHGKPVPFLVAYGLSEAAFTLTDRGGMRRLHDVLHIAPQLAADAVQAFSIKNGQTGGRVAEIDVADTVAWWSPTHDRLIAGTTLTKGLSAAFVRIGFGARWAIQTTDMHREYVMNQYKALMANDTYEMTKATATLWKKLIERSSGGSSTGSRLDRSQWAATCFYYANPQRAEVKPVVKDLTPYSEQLKNVLTAMDAAFMAAHKGAAHPYQFTKDVLQRRVAPVKSRPTSNRAKVDANTGNGAELSA